MRIERCHGKRLLVCFLVILLAIMCSSSFSSGWGVGWMLFLCFIHSVFVLERDRIRAVAVCDAATDHCLDR